MGGAGELAGVDRRLLELFSSRHQHIDRQAAQFQATHGRPPTLRERDRLAARDRGPKTEACRAPHWPAYRAVLCRHGLKVPAPHRQHQREGLAPLAEREAVVQERLLAPDELTGQDATFDQATLTKAVYQAATGLLAVEEASRFLERFTAGPDLIPVATPDGPRFTTAVLLGPGAADCSDRVGQGHHPSAGTKSPACRSHGGVGRTLWNPALGRAAGGAGVAGRPNRVGVAGRLGRNGQDHPGPDPGPGLPGQRPTRAAGLDRGRDRYPHRPRSRSGPGLDRGGLRRAVTTGRLRPQAEWVVLVEEAAMMDTHRMATLLQAAGPAAIRTLEIEQAQPVGAGGWPRLVDQAIGGHAQLTTVVQQRDPADRAVCAAIREGRARQALADLRASWSAASRPDQSSAVKELVYGWDRHRQARGLAGVAIVTDTDNATVDVLSALCQAKRRTAGELTGPGVTVTDGVTGRREQVHEGDRVRFIRPYLDRSVNGGYVQRHRRPCPERRPEQWPGDGRL